MFSVEKIGSVILETLSHLQQGQTFKTANTTHEPALFTCPIIVTHFLQYFKEYFSRLHSTVILHITCFLMSFQGCYKGSIQLLREIFQFLNQIIRWTAVAIRPWQTRTHCCEHTVAITNIFRFAGARNSCSGHKFCLGHKKCF